MLSGAAAARRLELPTSGRGRLAQTSGGMAAEDRKAFELSSIMALFRQQERALSEEHSRQRAAFMAWLEKSADDAAKTSSFVRVVSGETAPPEGGDISNVDDSDEEQFDQDVCLSISTSATTRISLSSARRS